jgi:SAM-dependent methyltransferase
VTLLDQRPLQQLPGFVEQYCSMHDLDPRRAAQMIRQGLAHERDASSPRPSYLVALEERWYRSLVSGTPDYSIYDAAYYFVDLWVCWATYSRGYLRSLRKIRAIVGEVGSVVDMGCGIGYTTAALTELYPDATVAGVDQPDTTHYPFAARQAKQYGFRMRPRVDGVGDADLVFASEFFEHVIEPLAVLREIVAVCYPRHLFIANSFNTLSHGHFAEYTVDGATVDQAAISRRFNRELLRLGYEKQVTGLWNNRPALWSRP